jgi:hypothetical protein
MSETSKEEQERLRAVISSAGCKAILDTIPVEKLEWARKGIPLDPLAEPPETVYNTLRELLDAINTCPCGGTVVSEDDPKEKTLGFRCDAGRRSIYLWDLKETLHKAHPDPEKAALIHQYINTVVGRERMAESLTKEHKRKRGG